MSETFQANVTECNGLETLTLGNADVQIIVVPELGGKIWSLIDHRSRKEWMWHPPNGDLHKPHSVGDFAQSCLGGADECLPTIAACTWNNVAFPDHGEAWALPWEWDSSEFSQGRIVTWVTLPLAQITLCRSIQLNGQIVRFTYRAENRTQHAIPFLWAFHPLLVFNPGDQIVAPDNCRQVRLEFAIGVPGAERGDYWSWPHPSPDTNLARGNLGGPRRAAKVYTDPAARGTMQIFSPTTQSRLSVSYRGGGVNTFGLWINQGGWNGYQHVAIEPATGAPDSLALAVSDWKRYAQLEPQAVAEWRLDLEMMTQ